MKKAMFLDTNLGRIGLAEEDGAITNVFFGGTVQPKAYSLAQTPLLCEAAQQILAYTRRQRTQFDLPLRAEGTAFCQQVWTALRQIPYGQTTTYGAIAKQIGHPKACRAVGRANRSNPLSILVPCHRVVGANGTLTGYAGGLAIKEQLLRIEGVLPEQEETGAGF